MVSVEHEVNECRVMADQWHQRYETIVGPAHRALLGIGDENATETYPGLDALPLPNGHHNWYAFREEGADEMSLYFCPPPFRMSFMVTDARTWRFFDALFREGDGYRLRDSEHAANEAVRRDHDEAVEEAFARR